MQTINIIVEARTNSKRLPGKVLLKVLEKPLLELMIERLKRINIIDNIIIATTTNKEDDKIEKLAKKNKVLCFRGSEDDVLGRVLEAAKQFNTDIIVQITGDNPLIDKEISENIIKFFIKNKNKYDFVSNDIGIYNNKYKINCLIGFSTKVYKTSLLIEVNQLTKNPLDREVVSNFILKNINKYKVYNFVSEKKFCRPDLRLTLDYKEDYLVIKSIYEALYSINPNFSALEIINFLDTHQEIKNINEFCVQNKYEY